jgi:hypothetical protein
MLSNMKRGVRKESLRFREKKYNRSSFLSESVLQNNFVNDLSTGNTSPPEIIFGPTIELFLSHRTSATVTFHKNIPSYGVIYLSPFEISMLLVIIRVQTGQFGLIGLRR